ncbi:D-amino acid dehydrogenase [Brucella sp. NBRC 12952]|uniref:FAD-binding oxidoreductase n=2 Tax=Brucella TaxID=234 RepID=A0A7Y3T8Y7_9HYPH|nr:MULTISPECIES: FAD-dependent oxidoreductase [Brucella]NNV23011.1 FAD-binding oxidoreductase [Brucella pseudogrignonensis]
MAHRQKSGERLSVAIIGAGIVGCSTALAVSKAGYSVTIFGNEEPGTGTSYGNAGAIVTGSVTPTATPAVIRSLPSYMFNRNSPAVLRLHHAFAALPWIRRFITAGRTKAVDRIAAAMHPLVSEALNAHRELAAIAAATDMLTHEGWLKVYRNSKDFEGSALERRLMSRYGVVHTVLDRPALLDLEPALDPASCYKGLYQPNAGNVRFPQKLAQLYLETAQKFGATFIGDNITSIQPSEHGVLLRSATLSKRFDRVVIASGAWSAALTKQLGDRVSLESERGYHISFGPGSEALLRGPVVVPGKGFVLSPMHDGLRLVSGDELAGLKAQPNYNRIRNLLPEAIGVLPALKAWKPVTEWMGHRPSTPDTLPVIGRSGKCRNVIYAFGHGHLGVTLSAITARLVNELISEQTPAIDLAPYSPKRF